MNHETQHDTLRSWTVRGRVVPVPAAPRGLAPQLAAAALGVAVPGRFGNYAVQRQPGGSGLRTLFKRYRGHWPGACASMHPLITLGPNYAFLHSVPNSRPQYPEYLAMLNYALGFHAIAWVNVRGTLAGGAAVICAEDVTEPGLDRPRVMRAFSGALLLRARRTQYVGADIVGGITLPPGECRFGVYADAVPPGNRFNAAFSMRSSPLTYRPPAPVEPTGGPVADAGILAGLNPDPDAPVPHDSHGEPAGAGDGDEYLGDVHECENCGYEYDHEDHAGCPDCGYEP